jgi:hypothetical protein
MRRVLDEESEQVATADVNGRPALIVPVTEEVAREASAVPALADMEVLPVSREEIEQVCANHDLALVGFLGFEPDSSLSIVDVETVGMILEEGG